jgi:hypothetical protein
VNLDAQSEVPNAVAQVTIGETGRVPSDKYLATDAESQLIERLNDKIRRDRATSH